MPIADPWPWPAAHLPESAVYVHGGAPRPGASFDECYQLTLVDGVALPAALPTSANWSRLSHVYGTQTYVEYAAHGLLAFSAGGGLALLALWSRSDHEDRDGTVKGHLRPGFGSWMFGSKLGDASITLQTDDFGAVTFNGSKAGSIITLTFNPPWLSHSYTLKFELIV